MKYRLLLQDEWHRLSDLMDPKFIPNPDMAMAAVAEDESGNLAGVLFLQMVLHMEPLVLTNPAVRFDRLHDTLYNAAKVDSGLHFYVFSDKEIIDRMAAHVGLKKLPYRVYEREIS